MSELLGQTLDALQIAHDFLLPHTESDGSKSGGGANPLIILAGVLLTLGAVAGLVWVKKRTENADEGGEVTEERDRSEDMEERSKELERDIEETERDWERRKEELPSADDGEASESGSGPDSGEGGSGGG